MAKRWTDTEKWKDDWYISLSNDNRIVWQWLLDNCNHAGICKRSIGLLNMMCRVNYTEQEMINHMDTRVLIHENIWFIPKFIKFQYSTLHSGKAAVVSVVKALFEFNCLGMIPESFGNDYIIKEQSFANHCIMIKDKDKDKDIPKGGMGGNNGIVDSGIKFNDRQDRVYFADNTFQILGMEQRIALKEGTLRPRDVKRGNTY
jgi:hypothetical protein